MGKKKQTYKIAEHEQQHKRVDIFRNILMPQNLNENVNNLDRDYSFNYVVSQHHQQQYPTLANIINSRYDQMSRGNNSTSNPNNNGYVNESFFASNPNLNRFPDIYTIETTPRYSNDIRNSPPIGTEPTQFTTTSTLTKKSSVSKRSQEISKKSKKGKCELPINRKVAIIIGFVVLLIVALICLAVALVLLLKKDHEETDKSIICSPSCQLNRYCVKPQLESQNASCLCKPGFSEDFLTKKCIQNVCYSGYYPHTYINTNEQANMISLPYDTQFLKPYCCPNENYLTPKCCGISMGNRFTGNKRIIGGDVLKEGTFPWIVYLTQIYRPSPNSPIEMYKNCSGALISDRYVLTAAHCTDLEPRIQFNFEFPNKESVFRVYFGFVDKSQIFKPTINTNYERRVRILKVHQSYNSQTLENDLAVLQLDRPIERNANVDYICLFNYSPDDNLVKDLKLYTAGWGSITPGFYNLQYPDLLNYVDARINPMSNCKYIFNNDPQMDYLFNPVTHVCAGYPNGKDTCYGDSGSPLMVELNGQWFIYGEFVDPTRLNFFFLIYTESLN
jgi:hypothetical protein